MNEKIVSTNSRFLYSPLLGLILLCSTCLFSNVAEAAIIKVPQQTVVTGLITDADGIPIPSVNIVAKGTQVGAVSDFDGNYSINVPAGSKILVFSAIGFNTQEVALSGRTKIDVSLESDVEQLEGIVVVGYGTQKKSDVTGSVSSIPQERLEQLPNNNFAQALQGSIPGLSISSNGSSAESNNVSITVRGRSSINASNSPLVVLDGIVYEGSISDINTQDIKSIEVLKDASSSAIYGSRGANGVILITTKQGIAGQISVSYDYNYGISEATNIPDILTPNQFYDFKKRRQPDAFTQTELDVYEEGSGVDWLSLALRKGTRTQHNLSVSGGAEKFKYFISGSYLDVEGIAVGDKFKRYSLRTNLTADVTDWLTITSNTQLIYSDRSGLDTDFEEAFYMNPLTRAYQPNGELTVRPWPEDAFFDNPLSDLNAINENLRYKVFTNNSFNVDIPFVKGLSYKLNTGIEFTYNPSLTYYGRNTGRGFASNGESRIGYRNDNGGKIDETSQLYENILTYKREFGKHDVFLTGLYSYQKYESRNRGLTGTLFPTDFLGSYQNDVAGLLSAYDSYSRFDLVSSMLRVNYGFDERYQVTLTVRRDGYSAFGKNSKFGNFPSAAFAWNVNNESFFNREGLFSRLKLRLSYGVNGNQSVDPYNSLALLNERSYVDGQTVAGGYIPFSLSSPDLSWETSKTANIGIDFTMLNSRINGTVDAYIKNTEDLLLRRSISPVLGSQRSYVLQNIGKVRNAGIEIGIDADAIRTQDFTWNVQFSGSYNKNEIVDVYGDKRSDTLNQWFIGKPINVNYFYKTEGVYQLNDDLVNTPQGEVNAGYAKLEDINGDGKISRDGDYVVQGQTDPDFIFGLGDTFSYRGLSLYVFLQGMTGMTRRNDYLRDDVFDGVRRNTTLKQWWTPERPTNNFWANDEDANRLGARIYEDASFLRIKDISLSYALPPAIIDQLGLNQFKVYATVRNLTTFTKFGGLDPELNDQRATPLQKEVVLGLSLGF